MSAANVLTSDSLIRDGEIFRRDWEDVPRFYLVRIYPHDPRGLLRTPRVKIHVELEGEPISSCDGVCDDDPDDINSIVFACIFQIECLCSGRWENEHDNERRQMEADYWRSRI